MIRRKTNKFESRKLTLEERIARLERALNNNTSAYAHKSLLERRVSTLEKVFGSKSALKDLIDNFDTKYIKNNIASCVYDYMPAQNIPGFEADDEYFGVNKYGDIIMNFLIIIEVSLKDGSKQYYPAYDQTTVENGRLHVSLSGIGEKTAKVAGLFTDLQNDIDEEELLSAINDLNIKIIKEFKNKDVTKLSICDRRDVEDGDVELEEGTFNNSEYAK